MERKILGLIAIAPLASILINLFMDLGTAAFGLIQGSLLAALIIGTGLAGLYLLFTKER